MLDGGENGEELLWLMVKACGRLSRSFSHTDGVISSTGGGGDHQCFEEWLKESGPARLTLQPQLVQDGFRQYHSHRRQYCVLSNFLRSRPRSYGETKPGGSHGS